MAHGIDTGAHPGRKVDINAYLAAANTPEKIAQRKAAAQGPSTSREQEVTGRYTRPLGSGKPEFREFGPGEYEKVNALLAGKGTPGHLTREESGHRP